MRCVFVCGFTLSLIACSGDPKPTPTPPVSSANGITTTVASNSAAPAPTIAPAALDDDAPRATRHETAFSMRYYHKIRKSGGNVLVAPAGLRQALGVIYLGAKGDTAREMSDALDLDPDPIKAAANAKTERFPKDGQSEIVIANRIWVDAAHTPKKEWADTAQASFGAGAGIVDFSKGEETKKTINAWVSENTGGKIVDLISTIDPKSRLIVTDAIYFKGRWAMPFPDGATKDEAFKVDAKKSVNAPMMHATESYRFGKARGAKALELGYDSSISMLLLLPDDASAKGLEALESDLSDDALSTFDKALTVGRVAVSVPRFEFKSGGAASAALKDLGMKTAFLNTADFSGIWEKKDVSIGNVVQKTFIKVDERGTEATAATGVVMHATSLQMGEPAEFRADRPFVFLIRDVKRGRVLFVGRVVDPTSKG